LSVIRVISAENGKTRCLADHAGFVDGRLPGGDADCWPLSTMTLREKGHGPYRICETWPLAFALGDGEQLAQPVVFGFQLGQALQIRCRGQLGMLELVVFLRSECMPCK
jgi:hypothetical protein